MLERFEEVRPGGVKHLTVIGRVTYARRKCHKVCAKMARWIKRKKRQNPRSTFIFDWEFSKADIEHRSLYVFIFSQP
jgi:hypothetical protein